MRKLLFGAFMLTLFQQSLRAQQYANLEFIENKGQWDKSIQFKADIGSGAFLLQQNGYKVVQHHPEDLKHLSAYYHGHQHDGETKRKNDQLILRSHLYDVQFVNASPQAKVVADKIIPTYNNYFYGNDPAKWGENCRIFQAVTYENIYPNIDVRYYTDNNQLKYDIIVKPGGDINKIALQYKGIDDIKIRNGELVVKTSITDVKEMSPYTFQVQSGQKKEISCRYKLNGNLLTFKVDDYNKNETLIIDPTLIFSTFTGSSADNWGYTATPGADGSFFAGGIVFGPVGGALNFPVSSGAFQTTFGGGVNDESIGVYDIGIMKFNANGTQRLYATYLGGSGNEQPHSMVADGAGNLVIAGRTNSANFPTTVATFGPGGGYDIFITKLTPSGTALVGSRKFGGTALDGVNIRSKYTMPNGTESIRRNYGDDSRSEVIIDNAGNILLASNTQSADFLTTAGVLQPTTGGGRQDGVLIKTNANLSTVIFSTFLGGNNDDAAFVLGINQGNNNIYVGGATASTNFPGNTAGSLFNSFQGGATDGFVSIISPDASAIIKTTYVGTAGADMLYGLKFDILGAPYIMGTTTATWPIVNAPFSQTGGKQFIAKLQTDLSGWIYSTVFGTNTATPNISPVAFLVDRCQNVYVSGWGGSINTGAMYANAGTMGLTVTPDANQAGKATTDGSDFYFFVLEKNAARQLFGSFFGQTGGNNGEHVDGGTSRFDQNGVIYQALCANCGRDVPFPVTPGVWGPSNGSSNCNLAAVKIAFNLAGVAGNVQSSINGFLDTSGCVPLTVLLRDSIGTAQRYVWSFGDGSPDQVTTTPTVNHTYMNIGTYPVRLIAIDSTTCNIADTSFTNVRVRNDDAILGFTPSKIPPCQSTSYLFTNNSFVPTNKPFGPASFRWTFGDGSAPVTAGIGPITHAYPGPGTYTVKMVLIDTNFCNEPDSVVQQIRLAANVSARFTTPPSGCAPYNATFMNTSAGGTSFFWDFGDGNTSTAANPTNLYTTPGTYTIKLRAIDSATCNIVDSTQLTITVSIKPTAAFTYSPQPPQENLPVTFTNNTTGAVTQFKWDFGDGDSIITASIAPVQHTYNATGTFNTCLIATNSFGCKDTTCENIEARIVPILDVANAFTPNGDGQNDKVFVRGFGIDKFNWTIYNRWGTVVFQSTNRLEGWDGTYKGKLQPQEVYHYVLDVIFTDNTKLQKKGDITLLR